MTPKEKAEELVQKFSNRVAGQAAIKACAIICCDEIKKVVDGRVKVLLEEANKPRTVVTESVTPPTSRITKQKIAEMIGVQFDPGTDTIRASTRTMNSPMPPTAPPGQPAPAEEVVRAITRDYSDLMAKLNELRPDVRGVYRT